MKKKKIIIMEEDEGEDTNFVSIIVIRAVDDIHNRKQDAKKAPSDD